jgi:hypothetical protein
MRRSNPTLRVRLLYQRENARTMARAIAPTSLLANRGKAIYASSHDLDTTTTYDITMLVDWRPGKHELPVQAGTVIWDVPEDIELHLDEPEYRTYFARIPVVAVANEHMRQAVRGLAHQVVVLPTWLPVAQLLHGKRQIQDLLCVFGFAQDALVLEALQAYIARHPRTAIVVDRVATLADKLPCAVLPVGYDVYVKTLHVAKALLLPRKTIYAGDGFWARDARLLQIPVLASPGYDHELPRQEITTCREAEDWQQALETLTQSHATAEERIAHRERLVTDWSVSCKAQDWWESWSRLA